MQKNIGVVRIDVPCNADELRHVAFGERARKNSGLADDEIFERAFGLHVVTNALFENSTGRRSVFLPRGVTPQPMLSLRAAKRLRSNPQPAKRTLRGFVGTNRLLLRSLALHNSLDSTL